MRHEQAVNAFDYVTGVLRDGSEDDFEQLCSSVDGFPRGVDGWLERHWITNAIHIGSLRAVTWMIHKGVDLSFVDDEGYSPLMTAIDDDCDAKYEIVELLLKNGAPTNVYGVNG
jgi:ankyrin repeat protein